MELLMTPELFNIAALSEFIDGLAKDAASINEQRTAMIESITNVLARLDEQRERLVWMHTNLKVMP